MADYKLMILISLACLTFAEWSGIVQWFIWRIGKVNKRIKPFDCAMCLSFWTTLCIFIYLHYEWWSILYAFANSGLTVLINKVYERLTKK